MLSGDEGVTLRLSPVVLPAGQLDAKMVADAELVTIIERVHANSRGTYGAPRVSAELQLGLRLAVNHKRVERLMRCRGMVGVTRRRGRGCTRCNPEVAPSDDVVCR